jgi:hypothetical protein
MTPTLDSALERAELYVSGPPGQPVPQPAALVEALARCGLRAAAVECINLLSAPARARDAGVAVTPCWRLIHAGGAFLVHGVAEDIDRSAVEAAHASSARGVTR